MDSKSGITHLSKVIAYDVPGKEVVAIRHSPGAKWFHTTEYAPIPLDIVERQTNLRTLQEFEDSSENYEWVETALRTGEDGGIVVLLDNDGDFRVAEIETVDDCCGGTSYGFYYPGEDEPLTLQEFLVGVRLFGIQYVTISQNGELITYRPPSS